MAHGGAGRPTVGVADRAGVPGDGGVRGDEDPALSIMLAKVADLGARRWRCAVGFLFPELGRAHLRPGAELLVLEGPRVVATARIDVVLA